MIDWSAFTWEAFATLVTGGATVAAAVIGFIAIVVQIGRQARAAIAQQRETEAMKLKVELYKEITETCAEVTDAEVKLSSAMRRALDQIEAAARDGNAQPPRARAAQIAELQEATHFAAVRIITTVERWHIIDPRMSVFQLAINVALHDLMHAWLFAFPLHVTALPFDAPDGRVLWTPPSADKLQRLQTATASVTEACGLLGSFVGDFRDAMQEKLLGELFPNPVKRREPLDPRYRVVTLEGHAELTRYFENETAYGETEKEARARAEATLRSSNSRSGDA